MQRAQEMIDQEAARLAEQEYWRGVRDRARGRRESDQAAEFLANRDRLVRRHRWSLDDFDMTIVVTLLGGMICTFCSLEASFWSNVVGIITALAITVSLTIMCLSPRRP